MQTILTNSDVSENRPIIASILTFKVIQYTMKIKHVNDTARHIAVFKILSILNGSYRVANLIFSKESNVNICCMKV